jgi:hypothetical protein
MSIILEKQYYLKKTAVIKDFVPISKELKTLMGR